MGRYKTTKAPSQVPQGMSDGSPPSGYSQYNPEDWPKEFPKEVIGIDRDGVINEWKNVIKRHEDVRETEEDLIKQKEEELRRKKALGKDN